MSRYTGSTYRKSRRLGFSILENGKELAKRGHGLVFGGGSHGMMGALAEGAFEEKGYA